MISLINLESVAANGEAPQPEYGSLDWAVGVLKGQDCRRFDPHNPPPVLSPILTLASIPVLSAGNIALLSGHAGVGKSHCLAAIVASVLAPEGVKGDWLGWEMRNPEGKAVYYLDFEQSIQDFYSLIRSAMRRAEVDTIPPWFVALHLAGMVPASAREILHALQIHARDRFGGTRAVLLDGVADLVMSPNDEAESYDLVRELHGWADTFHTGIFSVLHRNAGADSVKMRGHLGSQAERKAESVLMLKRGKDSAITVYATKTRHQPINESHGVRFAWNGDLGMFATVQNQAEARAEAKAEERAALARHIFSDDAGMKHADAVALIMERETLKERAAKLRLQHLRSGGFVRVDERTGLYHLGELSA